MNGPTGRGGSSRPGPAAREAAWTAGLAILPVLLVVVLVLPLASLVLAASPGELVDGLANPLVGPALRLSLFTTLVSVAFIVAAGTPLAWFLARWRGRAARTIEVLVQIPVVVPPAVGGLALLLAFGRQGLLGPLLGRAGVGIPFTRAAVILAEIFVAAPFFIQAATDAFRRVNDDFLVVARSLGAGRTRVFFTVAVPLALPGLIGGAAMAWARALGEFGATLMFAGNFGGRTQTLPLAIYTALESDLGAARAIALILVAVAFVLLLAIRAGFQR
jgi:molybdate transport system permease protein